MNCERIAELLPDYLQGSLALEQAITRWSSIAGTAQNRAQDVVIWEETRSSSS